MRTKRAPFASALALFAAVASGLPACGTVLGLDPPSLDPCQGANGCSEGGASLVDAMAPPVDTGPAGSDAGTDVAVDAVTPVPDVVEDRGPVEGTRCGNASMALGCTGSTPVCCVASDGDGGPATFSCETTSSCGDFQILCASNADCAGSDVCCNSGNPTEFKCVGVNSCSNGSLVCDPSGPSSQCTSGYHCSGTPVVINGTTLPYYLCVK